MKRDYDSSEFLVSRRIACFSRCHRSGRRPLTCGSVEFGLSVTAATPAVSLQGRMCVGSSLSTLYVTFKTRGRPFTADSVFLRVGLTHGDVDSWSQRISRLQSWNNLSINWLVHRKKNNWQLFCSSNICLFPFLSKNAKDLIVPASPVWGFATFHYFLTFYRPSN